VEYFRTWRSSDSFDREKTRAYRHNLSNAQTAGFKKDVPVFHKIFSGAFSSYQPGEFETSVTSFQQGELQATRNPLDLAIEGEGFFKVKTPRESATPKRHFRLNREGTWSRIADIRYWEGQGDQLRGSQFSVDKDGTVSVDGATATRCPGDLRRPERIEKGGQALFGWKTNRRRRKFPRARSIRERSSSPTSTSWKRWSG